MLVYCYVIHLRCATLVMYCAKYFMMLLNIISDTLYKYKYSISMMFPLLRKLIFLQGLKEDVSKQTCLS